MNCRLPLLVLALCGPVAGRATDLPKPGEGAFACPPLMTDRECAVYARALASLPPGDEREAFLQGHAELMREREQACSCVQHREAVARVAPARYRGGNGMRF